MRELIIGAGLAAALGLALGDLAQPQLALDAASPMEPAQPTYAALDAPTLPAYSGHIPDHVIGQDWLPRNDAAIAEALAEAEPRGQASAEWSHEEPTIARQAEDQARSAAFEGEAPASSYPSVEGDILAGAAVAEPSGAHTVEPDA